MSEHRVPPAVDLTRLTPTRLRDLMRRYREQGFSDLADRCLEELRKQGAASKDDYRHLKWNQTAVNEAMKPFSTIAASVAGNSRTSFTAAGGTKIGRSKADPLHHWVDTYAAIKTKNVNAVFVCYIKNPGDDPLFQLHVGGIATRTFSYDQLDDAILDWREIARVAS